jgi:hypothetical protein
MEWEWYYEKEGFVLPSGYYLPDFWIETINSWAEVKPKSLTKSEKKLAKELAVASGFPVLLLDTPEQMNVPYFGFTADPLEDGYEFCLTNTRDYPTRERRLFAAPNQHECWWQDTEDAVTAAKSARFEHGEKG